MENVLNQEIIPVIDIYREMIDALAPILQDKFTTNWNGIKLDGGEPQWIKPSAWNGYWELSSATSLFSGNPALDTYWPLTDKPGLAEMITMDLQYLEGVNYNVPSDTIYTDTLISVHFDWFAALYSKDYATVTTLAEKVVNVYMMQHNLSSLLNSKSSLLSADITPGNPTDAGKVSFHTQSMLGYPNLAATLKTIANSGYSQSLADAFLAEDKEPEPITEDPTPVDPKPTPGDLEADPKPTSNTAKLLVIILWPLTLLGAFCAAFRLGRRP